MTLSSVSLTVYLLVVAYVRRQHCIDDILRSGRFCFEILARSGADSPQQCASVRALRVAY